MCFKDFLFWTLGSQFVLCIGTICAVLVEAHYGKNTCEIILNLDQWYRRCVLKIFLFWTLGSQFVLCIGTICECW